MDKPQALLLNFTANTYHWGCYGTSMELWQTLDALVHQQDHQIRWHWVKGHAGDPGNERADALANRGAAENMSAV